MAMTKDFEFVQISNVYAGPLSPITIGKYLSSDYLQSGGYLTYLFETTTESSVLRIAGYQTQVRLN